MEGPFNFSPDGSKIYFNVRKASHTIARKADDKMLTSRLEIKVFNRPVLNTEGVVPAVVVVGANDKIFQPKFLTGSDELVKPESIKGNKYFLWKTWTSEVEGHWNKLENPKYHLVSVENGRELTFIPESQVPSKNGAQLSPNEKFAIWYDLKTNDIHSYETETGMVRNISKDIRIPLRMQQTGQEGQWKKFDSWSIHWAKDDQFLLIFDEFDLWKIDPQGTQVPVKLTEGRNSSIRFRFTSLISPNETVSEGQKILLGAINEKTGLEGYWNVLIGNNKLAKPIMMSQYHYSQTSNFVAGMYEGNLVKSLNSNSFLVTRQNAETSANLFLTKDFRQFTQISKIKAEQAVNWMTAEMITYPMPEGKTGRGILYKPENFDPAKKYPVIFNYYQKRNNEFTAFRKPGLSVANIDVAWYVSNGYLVFMPDIFNDEPGRITKNTLDAVESAVRHFSEFPWFNVDRIGIQGQSFGGYETNILATNSRMFKAAVSVAAPSNLISYSGSLSWGGFALNFAEVGQPNLQAIPWENPAVYIENSPVFQVSQTVTPLLVVHGKEDKEAVPFEQGWEMYQAMRRAGKPVWFLNYLDGGHLIGGLQEEVLDFTIRMQQFFDHFLKDKPMPKWMVTGENPGFELVESAK